LIFLSFGYEKIRHLGKSRQLYSALILQNLQEAFNGIKEIFIYKMQDLFLKRFYFLNNKNSEVGKKKIYSYCHLDLFLNFMQFLYL
jgi:hypothetical protein